MSMASLTTGFMPMSFIAKNSEKRPPHGNTQVSGASVFTQTWPHIARTLSAFHVIAWVGASIVQKWLSAAHKTEIDETYNKVTRNIQLIDVVLL